MVKRMKTTYWFEVGQCWQVIFTFFVLLSFSFAACSITKKGDEPKKLTIFSKYNIRGAAALSCHSGFTFG